MKFIFVEVLIGCYFCEDFAYLFVEYKYCFSNVTNDCVVSINEVLIIVRLMLSGQIKIILGFVIEYKI